MRKKEFQSNDKRVKSKKGKRGRTISNELDKKELGNNTKLKIQDLPVTGSNELEKKRIK